MPVGEAVVTGAGLLKAKHIVHANGPKFREPDEEGKLREATKAALLHLITDAVASLGVLVVGVVLVAGGPGLIDPVLAELDVGGM